MANIYEHILITAVVLYFFMCLKRGKYFPTQVRSPLVTSFFQSCSWTVAFFSRFSVLKLIGECGKKI